jgi:glycosidase
MISIKKSFSIVVFFALTQIFTQQTFSQVVTTNPVIVTTDYTGVVEVIFNAAEGSAGLKDYTGTVYAHTGINNWQHAPTWGANTEKYKLESLGNNLWKLLLTPDMRTYYGAAASETIERLCFVFRSGEKKPGSSTDYYEGKDVGGTDIFVDVIDPVLSVQFETPSEKNVIVEKNVATTFKANSILSTSLSISVDGVEIQNTTANTLTVQRTFTNEGNYNIVAAATDGTNTVRDTIKVAVLGEIVNESRPAGLQDGITVYVGTDSASFSLYAPLKSNIIMIGEFNDWAVSNAYMMKKDGDYFWITLHNLARDTEYAFQYLIDGSVRVGDPYCKKILDPWNDKYITSAVYPNLKPYPATKTTGTVSVFSTASEVFNWTDSAFVRPSKEQLVIYEMLFRDFTTQGTIKAAEAKLDYLKSLGVNVIELMPVMEFDGNNSWGYNPTFYFAPDKAYGTVADYKKFIDECHKRGMAVILDIVINHCWGESPLAKMWWDGANNRPAENSPYANPIAKHEYNVGNDLNHESPATRKYFKSVIEYWIKEFHIDGYRFDLSKGLTQNNTLGNVSAWGRQDNSRIAIIKDYQNTILALDSNFYVILEHFADNTEEKILSDADMMLWGNLNYGFCESAMGWAATGNFSGLIYLNRGWTKPNLVGFMESHDEERVGYKTLAYGNWSMAAKPNLRALRAGLSATFALLAPGPKMIWQFGEMNYDVSINQCGNGTVNESCRTDKKVPHWEYLDSDQGKYVFNAYSNVLALRNNFPQVFSGLTGNFSYQNLSGVFTNLRRYVYTSDNVNIVVLGNFNNTAVTTVATILPSIPAGRQWYDYIAQEPFVAGDTIRVPEHRFLILIDTLTPLANNWFDLEVEVANENLAIGEVSGLKISPNPANNKITVSGKVFNGLSVAVYKIYSMQGLCVLKGMVQKNGIINIGSLATGIYVLELNGKRVKFVKQ